MTAEHVYGEPETVLQGIIMILRVNMEPMTTKEITDEMNRRGWFQNNSGLCGQVSNKLTEKSTKDNFIKNCSNGVATYSIKN